jgi:hypothetical protein
MRTQMARNPMPPYQAHSDTSHAAAESMIGVTESLERAVFDLLRRRGPLADFEINALLGGLPGGVRWVRRRVDLLRRGVVRDTGERRENPETGRKAAVWSLVPGVEFSGEILCTVQPNGQATLSWDVG